MQKPLAVMTGASTGIGAATLRRYVHEGWDVAAIGRNVAAIEEVAKTSTNPNAVTPIRADLSRLNETTEAVMQISSLGQPVGSLINIAGVWHDEENVFYGKPLWELPEDQLESVMAVGIMAPMRLARGIVPLMFDVPNATVLNLSGTFSSGGANWIHYFTSKRALEQFTFALADELKPHRIRVNCASPADVATDALKKYFSEDADDALSPDEVARFIWLLNSIEFEHVTGQIIEIRA